MFDKHVKAFSMPRMRMTNKWDFQFREVLESLSKAKMHFIVYQNEKGELKIVHSGLDEGMYAMMQAAMHRNIPVHDVMKIVMINIDKFRSGEMNEAFEIMYRAVEYIRIKNSENLYL